MDCAIVWGCSADVDVFCEMLANADVRIMIRVHLCASYIYNFVFIINSTLFTCIKFNSTFFINISPSWMFFSNNIVAQLSILFVATSRKHQD